VGGGGERATRKWVVSDVSRNERRGLLFTHVGFFVLRSFQPEMSPSVFSMPFWEAKERKGFFFSQIQDFSINPCRL